MPTSPFCWGRISNLIPDSVGHSRYLMTPASRPSVRDCGSWRMPVCSTSKRSNPRLRSYGSRELMMPVYRANQGDCMSSISQHFGFSWQTLWDLKDNAALRAQRQHPNVLMPGDEVFIPDKRLREESCVTTQSHLFRLKGVPCRLNVVFLDERSNPRAGLRYTVVVDGTSSKGVTSPEGLLTTLVPPDADLANITIVNEDGEQESYQMRLAYLNPVSDNSGVED